MLRPRECRCICRLNCEFPFHFSLAGVLHMTVTQVELIWLPAVRRYGKEMFVHHRDSKFEAIH